MNNRALGVFVSWTRVVAFATALAAGAIPVLAQHQPVGERFHIKADDLPAPFATPSASNPPSAKPAQPSRGSRQSALAGATRVSRQRLCVRSQSCPLDDGCR